MVRIKRPPANVSRTYRLPLELDERLQVRLHALNRTQPKDRQHTATDLVVVLLRFAIEELDSRDAARARQAAQAPRRARKIGQGRLK